MYGFFQSSTYVIKWHEGQTQSEEGRVFKSFPHLFDGASAASFNL